MMPRLVAPLVVLGLGGCDGEIGELGSLVEPRDSAAQASSGEESGLPSPFERPASGRSLSFEFGALTEAVDTYPVQARLSLKAFVLGGAHYPAYSRPRDEAAPLRSAGLGNWVPNWFGGLYVYRSSEHLPHAGLPHPGIWKLKPDGSATVAVRHPEGSGYLLADLSRLSPSNDGSWSLLEQGGIKVTFGASVDLSSWHSLPQATANTPPEEKAFASTGVSFWLPTQIESLSGQSTRIEYYAGSPIPRVVEQGRRGTSGQWVPVSRAYFFLQRQPQTELLPVAFTDVSPSDAVARIAYPGNGSANSLTPDASWAETRFSVDANQLLTQATVNQESYAFSYAPHPLHPLEGFTLPTGSSVQYSYLSLAASQYVQLSGRALLIRRGQAQQTLRWSFEQEGPANVNWQSDYLPSSTPVVRTTVRFPGTNGEPEHREEFFHRAFVRASRHVEPSGNPLRDWLAENDPRIGAMVLHRRYAQGNQLRGETVSGMTRHLLGNKDLWADDGVELTCPQYLSFPSFSLQVAYDDSGERQLTVIRHREQSRQNPQLESFGPANPHEDFDLFGNAPRMEALILSGQLGPQHLNFPQTQLSFPSTQATSCVDRVSSGQRQVTVSGPGEPHDAILLGTVGIDSSRTMQPTYLIEDPARAPAYLAQGLTGLVVEQRELKNGQLVSRQLMDYDHQQQAYPAAAGTGGDLSTAIRGRLTFRQVVNLDEPANSSAIFYAFHAPTNLAVPPSALAEMALKVRAGSTPEYRRQRFGYQPQPASVGVVHSATGEWTVAPDGEVRLVSEQAHNAWNQRVWSRDPHGNVSRVEWDRRGRPVKSFTPVRADRPLEEFTYLELSSPMAVVKMAYLGDQALRSVRYLDSLGRVIQTKAQTNGGYLTKDFRYDRHTGAVVESTLLPFVTSQEGFTATPPAHPRSLSILDDLGRVVETRQLNADGQLIRAQRTEFGDSAPSLSLYETRYIDWLGNAETQVLNSVGQLEEIRGPDGALVRFAYDVKGRLSQVIHPDGKISSRTYDGMGRVKTLTSPENGTTRYAYDLLGQIEKLEETGGKSVVQSYDKWGRLWQVRENTGNLTRYRYDTYPSGAGLTATQFGQDRVTQVETLVGSAVQSSISYGMDRLGRTVEEATFIRGFGTKRGTFLFDRNGLLREVEYQPGEEDRLRLALGYDSLLRHSELVDATRTPRVVSRTEYDALGQVAKVEFLPQLASTLQEVDYRYDELGRLTQINEPMNLGSDVFGVKMGYGSCPGFSSATPRYDGTPACEVWAHALSPAPAAYLYQYDTRGRLSQADFRIYGASGWTDSAQFDFQAEYDSVGSLSKVTVGTANGLAQTRYQYSASRQLQSVDGLRNASLVHDAAGRVVADSRLGGSASSPNFRYGSSGRVSQIDDFQAEVQLRFQHHGGSLVRQELSRKQPSGTYAVQSDRVTVHLAGAPVAVYENGILRQHQLGDGIVKLPVGSTFGRSGLAFALKDLRGSTRAVLHESGTVLQYADYLPFGEKMEGRSQVVEPHPLGEQQYTGYGRLGALSVALDDARARLYDSTLGRFLGPDPIASQFPNSSAYAYAANNPIGLVDPTGFSPEGPGDPVEGIWAFMLDEQDGLYGAVDWLPMVDIVAPGNKDDGNGLGDFFRELLGAVGDMYEGLWDGMTDDLEAIGRTVQRDATVRQVSRVVRGEASVREQISFAAGAIGPGSLGGGGGLMGAFRYGGVHPKLAGSEWPVSMYPAPAPYRQTFVVNMAVDRSAGSSFYRPGWNTVVIHSADYTPDFFIHEHGKPIGVQTVISELKDGTGGVLAGAENAPLVLAACHGGTFNGAPSPAVAELANQLQAPVLSFKTEINGFMVKDPANMMPLVYPGSNR